MAERGARSKSDRFDASEKGQSAPSSRQTRAPLPRFAGAVVACAALAGCNAHERGPTASVTPDAAPVMASAGQTGPIAGAPGARPAAASQIAAAAGVPAARPVGPATVAAKTPAKVDPSARKLGRSGGGLASWYGDRFHGRPTANGERFDMGGFTAAHRTLPLPSYVRVTNVTNGRSIVVRVNDRGPFHSSRVIDVSRRTADVLGFRSTGVGSVKLDYVGPAPDSGSDDRRLLASYQEFGHPSAPPGVQVASIRPVSDGELAAEAGGGTFAVASAAVATSISAVKSSASTVASTAKAAVRTILPGSPATPEPQRSTVAMVASAQPVAPTAYSAPQPLIAAPAAIVAPKPAAKRVIQPSAEPVLASSTPGLRSTIGGPIPAPASQPSGIDVSSRIAASFDSFSSFSTTVRSGGSATADAVR
jgi:rare lipoprotein A